ncbi:hypothetical protein IMSAGC019_01925 [Lachnospiraceae bacterium]|nr:hypothetical protein IMSAGC019_01925 [Lachnospiraceae bacterium]
MNLAQHRHRNWYRNNLDYIISYLAVVVPRLLWAAFFVYPLRVTGDELYLFYLPAKLAGLDWKPSMYAYRYYGYGFSVFLTPLFYLTDNPVLLYRLCLAVVAFVEGTIPIVCCYLIRNFLKVTDKAIVVLISIACSYGVNVTISYMYNEHIYTVMVWLAFFCIARLIQFDGDKKRKLLYSFLLGATLVVSLTIHQRAVTLVIGFLAAYFFSLIFYKRNLGYAGVVLPVYIIGAAIDKRIVSWAINFLKGTGTGGGIANESINNTGVSFAISKSIFTNVDYFQAVMRVVIGQINIWNFAVYGFAVLSVILFFSLWWKLVWKRNKGMDKYIILFSVFGLVCVLVSIGGQAVSWGWGVKDAYMSGDSRADDLRALVYLRYLYAYFPPVLAVILAFIYKRQSAYGKLYGYCYLANIILMSIWLKFVVPFIQNNEAVIPKALSFTKLGERVSAINYFVIVFFVLFVEILIFALLRHGRFKSGYLVLCVFIIYKYLFSAIWADREIAMINYHYTDGAYGLIRELTENEITCPIYVYQTSIKETGQGILYQLQFMNMRHRLLNETPGEDVDEAVYITIKPENNKVLLESGYCLYQIDDNEYLYAKGTKVIGFLEETGKKRVMAEG